MVGLPERHPRPPRHPAARLKEPKSKATCVRPRVRRLRGVYLLWQVKSSFDGEVAASVYGGAAGAKRQLTRHSRQCLNEKVLRQTTFGNCRRTYGSSIRRDSSAKRANCWRGTHRSSR